MSRSRRYGVGALRLFFLLLPLFLYDSSDASAVVRPVDGGGVIGKEASIPFVVDAAAEAGDTVRLSGRFKLINPTVFFPIIFRPSGPDILIDSDLTSGTDSTWTFGLELLLQRNVSPGDTLFLLAGEALAGSDTTTRVVFSGLLADGEPQETREVRMTTIPVGPRLRYIRFGQLDPGFPNPATPGERVTWGFHIDKESEVIFSLYDVSGRMILRENLGRLDPGVYRHSIAIDLSTPSGAFLVHLATEIGQDYEVMHVLH